jgi:DNA replication protein DnaC
MLIHQTAQKLRAMKLTAMTAEYLRQSELPDFAALDFDERVGMLADAEWISRENSQIARLTKAANLRFPGACFADIDYRPVRKLDRAAILRLTDFTWVREARNLIITGATGTGKTWLASAFGTEACRRNLRVAFYRMSRLFAEMTLASGTGSMESLLLKLRKADILILDDWGLATLNPTESLFLLDVLEERYAQRATVIVAQLPVSQWHGIFEDSSIADAVLDRLVHNAYRIEPKGPSLRANSVHKDLPERQT